MPGSSDPNLDAYNAMCLREIMTPELVEQLRTEQSAQPSPQPAGAEPSHREPAEFLEGLVELEGRLCTCEECVGLICRFLRNADLPAAAQTIEMLQSQLAALRKSQQECVDLLRKYGPEHGMPEDTETVLANAAKVEGK